MKHKGKPVFPLLAWVLVGLLISTNAIAAEWRWAVAAEAPVADSPISAVAARAPYILIFDEQGALLEAFTNPVADAPRDAGTRLAEVLSEQGVEVLVAGKIGPKLAQALRTREIRGITAQGEASQALEVAQP
ncbi:NifB/NifX family molybdenum-iron cluster-binding protein [Desulfurivibrio sp. C05AmB]|uniref:NifB/NifX family molybdenum-iron cluster-binding protein n=1 Tax=Desulfurivibrio sp. C05AmB TaxID=3374371 RepID=UPI00376ED1CA